MKLRILTQNDVRAAINMRQAIDAMREAFGQLSAGHAHVPLRLTMATEKGVTLFMPAYLQATGDLGAKVVSVYGDNPQRGLPMINAVVLVLDNKTGVPLALMDGTYLTALRTGAGAGLATELLARQDASTVAVFGAGAQARTQLEAVRTVRPIREVRIVSRTHASAGRFANELEGVDVRVMDDRSAAVRGADIIVAATTSSTPVFDGNDVEAGTHINALGSFKPEMQEIDARVVRRAKIVVDQRKAALEEAGDLIIPIRQGLISADDIYAELGEIVNGDKAGRTSDDEITFFKSVGNAAQDVATARWVLQAAEEKGLGTVIAL
jgi:ornithine cyclodeaminase